jgi:hypothetical protein
MRKNFLLLCAEDGVRMDKLDENNSDLYSLY